MTELQKVSSCFHDEWIKLIIKDCEREAEECSVIKLLQPEGRAALWNICTALGFQSFGIPGQACLIFERYLYTFFVGYSKITDPVLRAAMFKEAQERCLVMITGCILLAAKMNSSLTIEINANVVRLCLLSKGISLSVDEIITTEMDIYITIKFQIPLWNTLDIALFLASEMNITVEQMRGVALIVDLSEFYKVHIEKDLRKNTQLPLQFRRNGNIIRSLHLAAAAVAAWSRLSSAPDSSGVLSQLINIPTVYIQCLCDSIIKQIDSNHQRHQPLILKRKRDP